MILKGLCCFFLKKWFKFIFIIAYFTIITLYFVFFFFIGLVDLFDLFTGWGYTAKDGTRVQLLGPSLFVILATGYFIDCDFTVYLRLSYVSWFPVIMIIFSCSSVHFVSLYFIKFYVQLLLQYIYISFNNQPYSFCIG